MIKLHTLENRFDGTGFNYHQFVQTPDLALMDSASLGVKGRTLGEFLEKHVVGCLDDELTVFNRRRLLKFIREGKVEPCLALAEIINTKGTHAGSDRTSFGAWTFDTVELPTPVTLRSSQEDVWAEHPEYGRSEWKLEVTTDNTHIGYWEWVEHMTESNTDEPSIR